MNKKIKKLINQIDDEFSLTEEEQAEILSKCNLTSKEKKNIFKKPVFRIALNFAILIVAIISTAIITNYTTVNHKDNELIICIQKVEEYVIKNYSQAINRQVYVYDSKRDNNEYVIYTFTFNNENIILIYSNENNRNQVDLYSNDVYVLSSEFGFTTYTYQNDEQIDIIYGNSTKIFEKC